MRRSRLPPAPVTHLEKHHAYTSPPQPERGGLPTIIVTPADSAQIQDFEIHFFSPKAFQFPALSPPQGIIPRVRSLFRRPPPPMPMPVFAEKADFFQEEDITEANAKSSIDTLITTTPTPAPTTSPARSRSRAIRNGGYVALPQSDDEEELGMGNMHNVPTITEHAWANINAEQMQQMQLNPMMLESGSGIRTGRFSRRTRTMLFLCVPVALVAFHLVTHHLGLLPGPHMWTEPSETPLGGPSL